MNEETVNKFFSGLKILHVFLYDETVQVVTENGAWLIFSIDDDGNIVASVRGPDPPEKEILRDDWDTECMEDGE
jgi:hypothetical protein